MADLDLQETAARLDAKVDALAADMKTGFQNAFEQTQGGFDDFKAFATLIRTESAEQFKHVHRRFDGIEDRFDRLEKLIKSRTPPPQT